MNIGDVYNPRLMFDGVFIPMWLLRRTEICPGAKLMFARIHRYAGEDGKVFVKQETISKELGYSIRQCQRFLDVLEENRLIKRHRWEENSKIKGYEFIWHEWAEDTSDVPPRRDDESTPPESHDRYVASDGQICRVSADINVVSSLREEYEEKTLIVDASEPKFAEQKIQTADSLRSSAGRALSPSFEDSDPYVENAKHVGRSKTPDVGQKPTGRGKPGHLDRPSVSRKPNLLVGVDSSGSDSPAAEQTSSSPKSAVASRPASARVEDMSDLAVRQKEQARVRAQQQAERNRQKEARKENFQGRPVGPAINASVRRFENTWHTHMEAAFPGLPKPKWAFKEVAAIQSLQSNYTDDEIDRAIVYVLTRWENINKRFFKGKGTVPGLSLLTKLHSSLFIESSMWNIYETLRLEVERYENDPDLKWEIPRELMEKFEQARKGVGGMVD